MAVLSGRLAPGHVLASGCQASGCRASGCRASKRQAPDVRSYFEALAVGVSRETVLTYACSWG
jgi:hypothetical protein